MKGLLLCALIFLATIPLRADDLAGRITSADGKPLRAAHVCVYTALPRSGPNTLCPSCYRDCGKHEAVADDGSFRVKALDDGLKFRLLAVASGYEPAFSDYVPPGRTVELTLQPRSAADAARTIRGKVVDPEGKPIVGAKVEPLGIHMSRSIGYGTIPGADLLSITDAEGAFALRLPQGASGSDVRIRTRNSRRRSIAC